MPYISASGQLSSGAIQDQPWSIGKLVSMFWAMLNFFYMLVVTLLNPGGQGGNGGSQSSGGGGGGSGRGGGTVQHISGERDMDNKLKEAGSRLVVVDFFATWCGPCKMVSPYIEEMAVKMPDVTFIKVDVDQCDNVAAKYEVRSMPTFVFLKNGRKLVSFSGADVQRIQETINRYR